MQQMGMSRFSSKIIREEIRERIRKMQPLIKIDAARGTSFFPTFLSQESLTKEIEEIFGTKMSEVFSVIRNDDEEILFLYEEEMAAIAGSVIKKLKEDNEFGSEVEREIKARCEVIREFAGKIEREKIKTATNSEIREIIKEFCIKTKELRSWGWIPNFANFHEENIVDTTLKDLEKNKNIPELSVQSIFALLTTSTEELEQNKANEELEKIREYLKAGGEIESKAKEYLGKYSYLTYHYKGPAMNMDDFMEIIEQKIKKESNEKKETSSERSQRIKKEQNEIKNIYHIDEATWKVIEEIKRMTYLKAYRKEAMIYSNYKMDCVLEEVAKRIKKDKNHVRCMLVDEIIAELNGKQAVTNEELEERKKEMITIAKEGKVEILRDEEKKAEIRRYLLKKEAYNEVIRGQCAYPGIARGIVKIIEKREDMKKFNEGDILISRSTNPDLILAMEKAAAIVTDIGGISCHAAIVSRELQKPCIIGTKNITKIVHDGMVIEVNANNGTIKIIN